MAPGTRIPGHGHGGTQDTGVWSQECARHSIAVAARLLPWRSSLLETMQEVALVQPDNNAHRGCANLSLCSILNKKLLGVRDDISYVLNYVQF